MKKKLVACLLVATMAVGLTACGSQGASSDSKDSKDGDSDYEGPTVSGETEDVEIDGITYHKATDLTEDEITLKFYHFMDEDTVNYMADRFMELYPNITVEATMDSSTDYQGSLLTLVNNQDTPDVFMYTDCEFALSNMLLYDMTSLFESDPETDELPETVNNPETGMGTFSTGHRLSVPAKFYPGIMYADRNVLDKLNIEVPGQDWTWSQMVDIIKKCTTEVNGVKYYGLGLAAGKRLDSYYGIASSQDIIGEFGFNGKTYDLSAWAVGEQEFAELRQNGYVAPEQNSAEMEAWQGAWDSWCGTTGQVALFAEEFWTFQNLWNTDAFDQYNLDIVPYVVPAVSEEDASNDHHSIATIYFGGISSATKYPREAYELMKFMYWGRDGWLTKIGLYNTGACAYKDGKLAYPGDAGYEEVASFKSHDMLCPITTNEEVWDAYIPMYCEGMDEEHTALWENYFASCMQPICYGWHNIAGYWNACDGYFNSVNIHDKVDKGEKAADYVDEGTRKFNWYHASAMIEYFGPGAYEFLSDDEIAEYEQIMKDNE